jgi:hypothetical protein
MVTELPPPTGAFHNHPSLSTPHTESPTLHLDPTTLSDRSDKLQIDNHASVVNLSSTQLTPNMISLLTKGMNFCPTPGEPDVHLLRQDLDKFHISLRRNQFFSRRVDNTTLDSDDSVILDSTPDEYYGPFDQQQFKNPSKWNPKGPPQLEAMILLNECQLNDITPTAPRGSNLTPEEKQAMTELQANTDIVIKPADKGSAVVIQDKTAYIQEGLRQLKDTNFYKEVPHDLTLTHNAEVDKLVHTLLENKEISPKCADYLVLDKPRTPQLYLLPKIHKGKTPVPGRPIVSGNNSPTERISQLADHFLQPLVQNTRSYVRDTTDFLTKLEHIKNLPQDTLLCTIDVSSLYTNIPNNEGIRACRKQLYKNRNDISDLTNESITQLLHYVLTKNNFDFNDRHFLQVGGTAMGTKVAPSFANLFMADFEDKHVYNYPVQPTLWLRYIDDIFLIWKHPQEDLEKFLDHLNSCHPTIKFTHEYSHTSVNFLDTTVSLESDGTLKTNLYCKPTDSHNYLHYSSAHPKHCKTSLPYSQFLRVRRICSNISDYDKNACMLAQSFQKRGYPSSIIEEAMIKVRRLDREGLLHPPEPPENTTKIQNLFLVTTFNPGNQPTKGIIQDNWQIIGRTHTTAHLHSKEIIFGHRRNENLRDKLVSAKLQSKPPRKPLTSDDPVTPQHQCAALRDCRYCPKLDHSGRISSHYNNRSYLTKKHISCRSNNLIYCITCSTCGLQYVGQTSNHIGERFKMHFQNIKSAKEIRSGKKLPIKNKREEPIGRHFSSPDHNGIQDILIHVLEFIKAPSKSPPGQLLRDQYERMWIHRLQTLSPHGLNTVD